MDDRCVSLLLFGAVVTGHPADIWIPLLGKYARVLPGYCQSVALSPGPVAPARPLARAARVLPPD